MNSALSWLSNLGLVMLPDHGFKNFFPKHQQQCNCEYCRSLNVDWTKLSNTEKMAKALQQFWQLLSLKDQLKKVFLLVREVRC